MTDFTINIKVTPVRIQLDVTPAMAALLTAMLQGKGATAEVTEQPKEEKANGGEDHSCATSDTTTSKTEEQPKEDKPQGVKTEEGSPAPYKPQQTEQPKEPEEDKPKALTAEDVRAAMHRTRQRIEGEDYKDHTDGELYQKYHKALTGKFKGIAALLGADKPSALPEGQRAAFIAQCDELEVLEDGTIGEPLPF